MHKLVTPRFRSTSLIVTFLSAVTSLSQTHAHANTPQYKTHTHTHTATQCVVLRINASPHEKSTRFCFHTNNVWPTHTRTLNRSVSQKKRAWRSGIWPRSPRVGNDPRSPASHFAHVKTPSPGSGANRLLISFLLTCSSSARHTHTCSIHTHTHMRNTHACIASIHTQTCIQYTHTHTQTHSCTNTQKRAQTHTNTCMCAQ